MTRSEVQAAWIRYRDTADHPRRALRRRDFVAGFEAGRASLEEPLRLAEDVAVVYGWCAVRDETEREKAAGWLWRRWAAVRDVSPRKTPHLTDAAITDMARQYDENRAAMLRELEKIVRVEPTR